MLNDKLGTVPVGFLVFCQGFRIGAGLGLQVGAETFLADIMVMGGHDGTPSLDQK
jgi:hypothetical protein